MSKKSIANLFIILLFAALSIFTLSACGGCNKHKTPIYTVTFMLDGEVYSSERYQSQSTIKKPQMPEREGFVFKGWYLHDNYTTSWNFATYKITSNVTLYGQYVPIENEYFNVYFYNDKTLLYTEKVLYNGRVKYIEPEITDGYEFKGWYAKGQLYDFDTPITADLYLNAKFKIIEYTATFVAEGNIVETVTFTVENMDITSPPIPHKQYYTDSWEKYELSLKNIVINVVYIPIHYEAYYYVESEFYKKVIFTVEDDVVPPAIPEKPGYTATWAAVPIVGQETIINAEYKPIIYTITLIADGNVYDTITYTVNDDVVLPPVPEKEGFDGVWVGDNGEFGDKVLTAKYTEQAAD